MHVCVQLLASLFYFIMVRVSDPALEIEIRMAIQMKGSRSGKDRNYAC